VVRVPAWRRAGDGHRQHRAARMRTHPARLCQRPERLTSNSGRYCLGSLSIGIERIQGEYNTNRFIFQ
jgi:hypothetical protein